MIESLKNKFLGAVSSAVLASQVNAFEVDNFPVNLNPVEVVKLMEKSTGSRGSESESAAVLLPYKSGFISVAANPNQKSIVPESEIVDLIKRVQEISKDDIHNKELWLIHNHPSKVIQKYWKGYSSKDLDYRKPDLLLNGPSLGDCKRMKEVKGFWKNKNINIINVIKEPGGTWLCSGDFRLPLPKNTSESFEKLREDLLTASQKYKNDELKQEIEKFENEATYLLGIKIKFIKNGSSLSDYIKTKTEVLKP